MIHIHEVISRFKWLLYKPLQRIKNQIKRDWTKYTNESGNMMEHNIYFVQCLKHKLTLGPQTAFKEPNELGENEQDYFTYTQHGDICLISYHDAVSSAQIWSLCVLVILMLIVFLGCRGKPGCWRIIQPIRVSTGAAVFPVCGLWLLKLSACFSLIIYLCLPFLQRLHTTLAASALFAGNRQQWRRWGLYSDTGRKCRTDEILMWNHGRSNEIHLEAQNQWEE